MKHSLLRKILAAVQLTRQGSLVEATAAIQRALNEPAGAGTHSTTDSGVAEAGAAESGFVIDGLVREVETARDEPGDETTVAEAPLPEAPRAPRAPAADRFIESSYTGAAGTRTFKLYAPPGHDEAALPLVVMLHGCTQNPDDFASGTRMNELAREEGCFVLYPAQAARSNTQKCWNWFSPGDQRRGAGEPALIAGMTRHILQTHRIDPRRVFVAGLSAGGAMAAILAREYPDLFAAAGVHSGLAAGAAHDVASAFSAMKGAGAMMPWASAAAPVSAGAALPASRPGAPVIVFHGDADSTVVAANGDAVVRATLEGGPGARSEVIDGRAASGRAFRRTVWHGDAGAPSLAEHWLVRGSPHAWSGGAGAGSYTDPAGPDASREMLRFFREHPQRIA